MDVSLLWDWTDSELWSAWLVLMFMVVWCMHSYIYITCEVDCLSRDSWTAYVLLSFRPTSEFPHPLSRVKQQAGYRVSLLLFFFFHKKFYMFSLKFKLLSGNFIWQSQDGESHIMAILYLQPVWILGCVWSLIICMCLNIPKECLRIQYFYLFYEFFSSLVSLVLFNFQLSYQIVDSLIWLGLRDIINDFRKKKLQIRPVTYLSGSQFSESDVPHVYLWSPYIVPKPKGGDFILQQHIALFLSFLLRTTLELKTDFHFSVSRWFTFWINFVFPLFVYSDIQIIGYHMSYFSLFNLAKIINTNF